MTDKLKLKESVKRQIRATYPMMNATIERMGNIAPMEKMLQTYGEEPIALALQDKVFTETKIIKRSKSNKFPEQVVKVVVNHRYDNTRPAWLDND